MLRIHYRNVLQDQVGPAGYTPTQLAHIGTQADHAVRQIKAEQAQRLYRRLPFNEQMHRQVLGVRDRLAGRCANLVVLGIGGSALGNIALHRALRPPFYNLMPADRRGGPRLFVMDNIDPATLTNLLDLLDGELDRTIFNIISKSGETAETAAQFLIVRSILKRRFGGNYSDRVVAVTDAKSGTMRTIADDEGYVTLPVPDGVGGRFTVLSAVGLFSAAMCGVDIEALLAGAREMAPRVEHDHWQDNPAATLAVLHKAAIDREQRICVTMPYADSLVGLADWFRQLWAESLGKSTNRTGQLVNAGQTPVTALGATDQHSQLQLYREGPFDKIFTFQEVAEYGAKLPIPADLVNNPTMMTLGNVDLGKLLSAEKRATEYALCVSGRPNLTVLWPKVDPVHVGQWIYLYETATSIMGLLLDINAYDQPAVELGKQAAYGLLGRKGEPFEPLAKKVEATLGRDDKYVV